MLSAYLIQERGCFSLTAVHKQMWILDILQMILFAKVIRCILHCCINICKSFDDVSKQFKSLKYTFQSINLNVKLSTCWQELEFELKPDLYQTAGQLHSPDPQPDTHMGHSADKQTTTGLQSYYSVFLSTEHTGLGRDCSAILVQAVTLGDWGVRLL